MDPNKPHLSESEFADMAERAISAAMGVQGGLQKLLKDLQHPSNGKIIHLPNGQSQRLGVSPQEIQLGIFNSLVIILQTVRITLVALNDLDTRLRQAEASQSGKVGDELLKSQIGEKQP